VAVAVAVVLPEPCQDEPMAGCGEALCGSVLYLYVATSIACMSCMAEDWAGALFGSWPAYLASYIARSTTTTHNASNTTFPRSPSISAHQY